MIRTKRTLRKLDGRSGLLTADVLSVMVLLFGGHVSAEQTPNDPFAVGVTLLSHAGCPLFVGSVIVGSPADRAGIESGDHILVIEETSVTDPKTAVHLLQSDRAGSVKVKLARGAREFNAVVPRERQSVIYRRAGKQIISGVIVPLDTSRAEVDRMLSFDGRRLVDRAFRATHYPRSPELFYGGFELFVLRDPDQVMVGGIEDGPAARAGIHWGDIVVSANGIPLTAKTAPELESLFSGRESKAMHLQIDRLGSVRIVEFRLERAGDIARQNGKRFVDGKILPLWAAKKDLHCFE